MLAVAAGERSKTTRKRGAGEDEEQGHPQGSDERKGTCKPNQERENSSNSCNRGHQPSTEHASFSPSSAANSSSSSSSSTTCQNKPIRRTAPAPFQGGRCTFGTRTGNDEGDALDTLARRRKHASKAIMGNDPHCSWGPQERAKLNEICECSRIIVVSNWAPAGRLYPLSGVFKHVVGAPLGQRIHHI